MTIIFPSPLLPPRWLATPSACIVFSFDFADDACTACHTGSILLIGGLSVINTFIQRTRLYFRFLAARTTTMPQLRAFSRRILIK